MCPNKKIKTNGVYPENQEKQRFRYLELRSKSQQWIPKLRFGYPPLRKLFREELRKFLKSLGRVVSAPALYKNPAVIRDPFFGVVLPQKLVIKKPISGVCSWCLRVASYSCAFVVVVP